MISSYVVFNKTIFHLPLLANIIKTSKKQLYVSD